MKKNIVIPKTIWGKELLNKNKKERIKIYLKESFVFSIILTILQIGLFLWKSLLDIIQFTTNKNINIVITFISLFILSFLIFYTFNFLISEYQVTRYNKKARK